MTVGEVSEIRDYCLGKIDNFAINGRTIYWLHNILSILEKREI